MELIWFIPRKDITSLNEMLLEMVVLVRVYDSVPPL